MRMGKGEIVSSETNVIGYQQDIFGEETPIEDEEEHGPTDRHQADTTPGSIS
jgi:hypothetical protein